jgi:hypothetical protein
MIWALAAEASAMAVSARVMEWSGEEGKGRLARAMRNVGTIFLV